MTHCPTCGEYLYCFNRPHTCPPQWRVWVDEDDTYNEHRDGRIIYAKNAGEAAEKFADSEDRRAEYWIVSQGYVHVFVREIATRKLYRVEVQAETVIEYNAREPKAVEGALEAQP